MHENIPDLAWYETIDYNRKDSDHRMEVAKMSQEEGLVYETFGGEDAYMKRIMQMYDSNGNFVNSRGVAGMLVNGVPQSQRHQIINVSESARDDMYEESLRHFKLENVGLWLN